MFANGEKTYITLVSSILMNRVITFGIIVLFLFLLSTFLFFSSAIENTMTIKKLANAKGILVGSSVPYTPDNFKEKAYWNTLGKEFNSITIENFIKMDYIQPQQGQFNFGDADAVVRFAERNGMKVRGHTLAWGNQIPPWVTQGKFTRDEAIQILQDHISTVVGHYRGQIYAWDVVNEPVDGDGNLVNNYWMQTIGPEYIEIAFRTANEADPDALLFLNEFGIEAANKKFDAILRLANDLNSKGLRIDGIGSQTHLKITNGIPIQLNYDELAMNMQRVTDMGFQYHITEMDIALQDTPTQAMLVQQADVYGRVMDICLKHPNCNSFTMWGFTDKISWIPYAMPGWGSALIFDRQYAKKPAYFSLLNSLKPLPLPAP